MTLDYCNSGIFLIMENAGFASSTVGFRAVGCQGGPFLSVLLLTKDLHQDLLSSDQTV